MQKSTSSNRETTETLRTYRQRKLRLMPLNLNDSKHKRKKAFNQIVEQTGLEERKPCCGTFDGTERTVK